MTDENAQNTEYEKRISQQIAQYKKNENIHSDLSESFYYWQKKYFIPRLREVFAVNTPIEFYAEAIKTGISRSGVARIASFGSGDGVLETRIAKDLIAGGIDDFSFDLIELSPYQNARAVRNAEAASLSRYFGTIEADFNIWRGDAIYGATLAHHALHHIADLEHFFDAVRDSLHEDGTFSTFDMIGRNGHMRWPEAFHLISLMWRFLPEDKHQHRILKRVDAEFRDHDCSTQGFEGIRSQDILPLLIERFHFEGFLSFGNLIDVFTGRGYGANFDMDDDRDRAFIDFVEELNELLIEVGYLKPTRMAAVLTRKPVYNPRLFRGRTPAMMVRPPFVSDADNTGRTT